jgi:protein-tyrosine phosphatase
LEGGVNFRDIGGYRAGTQQVRWGKVFRTGVLCYLTPNDEDTLRALGVRAICDLRRAEEREREPTRWPDSAARAWSWEDGPSMPTIRAFAARRPPTPAGVRDAMIDLYRALPSWMGPRIRGFLECIADHQTPVVVHCAAGKDRTGIAVGVLLSILGVDRSDVLADYLLTNDVGNFERFIERRTTHLGLADAHSPLLSMPPELRAVLFAADTDYLEATLDQIGRDYGNVENYLRVAAQIDSQTIGKIQQALLT